MVDDARRLTRAGFAEDRDVFGSVGQVEETLEPPSGGVAERGKRAGGFADPKSKIPGVLTSGPDRWRDVDLFADERKGRKRFAIEHVHERPKTDAAHDRGTGERREVVGVGEGERGRRNGADREHPEARGTLAKALA